MATAPSISARILVDWCRGDWSNTAEDPEGLQLGSDGMHRAVSAVLYYFQKPPEDPVKEVGRWAGPLKFSERPNSRKSRFLSEWFEGAIGPLPGSNLNTNLTVAFGFSGDLATRDLKVASLSGPGIDGIWNEDANPLVNFVFAGTPTTAWESKPPPGTPPLEFDYPALTLGLVSGKIEVWDFSIPDYFRFTLSPTWAR
jgi:hypothetical protein